MPKRMNWFDEAAAALGAGKMIELTPTGTSMWPALRPRHDTVILQRSDRYFPGDIVLARSDKPEGIILHRVMAVIPEGYLLRGDANLYQTEVCAAASVIGRVCGVRRDGKDITDGLQLRLLRRLHALPPAPRRFAVRLIHRLFPPSE